MTSPEVDDYQQQTQRGTYETTDEELQPQAEKTDTEEEEEEENLTTAALNAEVYHYFFTLSSY